MTFCSRLSPTAEVFQHPNAPTTRFDIVFRGHHVAHLWTVGIYPLFYTKKFYYIYILTILAVSGARYLRDGQIVEITPGGQLLEKAEPLEFLPGFAFEGNFNIQLLLS